MTYCYAKRTGRSFDEAETSLRNALQARGFGVITEIDARKTLKEKLGIEMRRYKILGACNPRYAHRAIQREPNVGVLLPCNVLIREDEEGVVVSCILPTVQLSSIGSKELCGMAEEVETRIKEAVDEVTKEI